MQKTKYYSYKIGNLAKGCKLCVQGKKLVMFVTGLCSEGCFFCPISEKKYMKDVIYANEWPIKNIHEVIKEAKLCEAEGAGITGGDPLVKLWRTLFIIRKLKKKFGKKFHIHLYTPLKLVSGKNLEKLYNAGLDEIRFHLNLDDNELWDRLELAPQFDWDVGVEIPVIPGYGDKLRKIILFLDKINKKIEKNNLKKNKIKFLNLNELEISDSNAQHLVLRGYKPKDRISYGVKGSEELALRLLKFIENKKIELDVHYCTTTLKDKVQLGRRVKRRAKNVAHKWEKIDSEGMITRGVIYLRDLKPSAGYRDRLNDILENKFKKQFYLKKLNKIKNNLVKKYKIKNVEVDDVKLRLYIDINNLKKIKINREEILGAVVREYPTWDQLELEVEFL